jgi:hypothetical protein
MYISVNGKGTARSAATAHGVCRGLLQILLSIGLLLGGVSALAAAPPVPYEIHANVVVFDNPTVFNRLGAQNPNWIMYALKRNVVHNSQAGALAGTPCELPGGVDTGCKAGMVELRPDLRPRPLVIRSVEGHDLTIHFTNLLDPTPNPNNPIQDNLDNNDQVRGRCAGFHATGTELRVNMDDDGSMAGNNPGASLNPADCGGGLVKPNGYITYRLHTPHEGAFVINSYGATLGSEQSGGNLGVGMFGALNVEPKGARMYRGQLSEEEMRLATNKHGYVASNDLDCDVDPSDPYYDPVAYAESCNPGGQPIVDYEATYPNDCSGDVDDLDKDDGLDGVWCQEGKAGLPILNMIHEGYLVHSDINAIIMGPDDDGSWRDECQLGGENCPYPLEAVGNVNPVYPNRHEAFREFTSVFHDEQTNSQVFPQWYQHPILGFTLDGVPDAFMINYGSGGIGSEIIANRLRTGPMHDCTDCAYEEFFLSSSTVGDPAQLVQFPANTMIEQCSPENIAAGPDSVNACWRDVNLANGPIDGNFALFAADPSNVHHSYTGDHVKVRNTHAGAFEQHIFHLHNHQWLFNPNDDNANYLDAQEIFPGSGHTYELVNGGAGNRNKTAGDAIFHCHFYPHFAQGMWYHIRIHDVMEVGTRLAVSTADDAFDADGLPGTEGDFDGDGFHDNRWALRAAKPAVGARALPDGELPDGAPIPAVVPLPGKALPPMPAEVHVAAVDRGKASLLGGRAGPDGVPDSSQAIVKRTGADGAYGPDEIPGTADDLSPGYPFWLAGLECGPEAQNHLPGTLLTGDDCPLGTTGQRMPTPPLDMLTPYGANELASSGDPLWSNVAEGQAGGWDGGLPRHGLLGYTAGGLSADTTNRLDFRKVVELAQPVYYPETGTDLEQVSMAFQGTTRSRSSVAFNADGSPQDQPAYFIQNGAPPVPGSPFNDPCIDDRGVILGEGDTGHWFSGVASDDPMVGNVLGTKGGSQFGSQNPRTYKIANLQVDVVFNKVGYHYPQERIIVLWEDVANTVNKIRPPEPLTMRFNTFDCGKLLQANLVPHEYELDDFQVRTPTDIIGQHIHLPKWDLTTNDGAANGWNYEDGTLAPGIVVERIHAINHFNELVQDCKTYGGDKCTVNGLPGQLGPIDLTGLEPVPTLSDPNQIDPGSDVAPGTYHLEALPHPFFGDPANANPQTGMYVGARTTIQRILNDPVVNVAGFDRGLGLTFSHDHYGPSTFQQIGLYSTILAEPAGSSWVHNETGQPIGYQDPYGKGSLGRIDGGPTSWQVAVLPPEGAPYGSTVGSEHIPDHREFYFEMSDFQHAYERETFVGADEFGIPKLVQINQPDPFNATVADAPALHDTWKTTINPPLKLKSVPFPDIVTAENACPGPLGNFDPNVSRPCAEAINISHSSMWVTNYRNEPVGLRVFDPNKVGPDGRDGSQADGKAGDLAFAFQSREDRAISALNTSNGLSPYPTPGHCKDGMGDGINCDRRPGDPFVPMMRAYTGDQVKIKIQVGATEEQHQATFHGLKWLSNGSSFGKSPNSGWRNFQGHGISEQFTLSLPFNPDPNERGNTVDYLYSTNATRDGIWSGTWGLMRAYGARRDDLYELPDNSGGGTLNIVNENDYSGVCPKFEMDENGDPIIYYNRRGKKGNPREIVPRTYDIAAVRANDVLPNNLGVTIPQLGDPDDLFAAEGTLFGEETVGGPLDPDGGTLIYNRRQTVVPDVLIPGEGGAPAETLRGGAGPLNDPTALMYVRLEDLEPKLVGGEIPAECLEPDDDGGMGVNLKAPSCPVQLKADAPVEPLVLRANAGDCVEVTLWNKLVKPATVNLGTAQAPVMSRVKACQFGVNELGYSTGECMEGEEPEEVFYEEEVAEHIAGGMHIVDGNGNEITDLASIRYDVMPDLAGWQDMFWVVNRDLDRPVRPPEMHFFNNNLVRPSGYAGLHAQLVEYDASRDDGVIAGQNSQSQLAPPGGQATYRYYAGDLRFERESPTRRDYRIVPTPIEFGGVNLLSADRIKQPQKGLFGALVIEPEGSTWPDALAELDDVPDGQGTGDTTRKTRAQVTVDAPEGDAYSGGTYREMLPISHKITNIRWTDGTAIANIHQGELGREGAEDSGHAGFNYGMEPSWFRFELPPDSPFGAAGHANSFGDIANVHAFYANLLVKEEPNAVPMIPGVSEAGDPATPVFRTYIDADNTRLDSRMHLLNGASADRDSTFVLHGHVWQRDPFVCPGQWDAGGLNGGVGLNGRCNQGMNAAEYFDLSRLPGSTALGVNPQGKYMGAEESMGHVYSHWPILFDAGGSNRVLGDYLYRDYAPNGNRNGQFGLMRVMDPSAVPDGGGGGEDPPPPPDGGEDPPPPPPDGDDGGDPCNKKGKKKNC